jgi:hypothetical protein
MALLMCCVPCDPGGSHAAAAVRPATRRPRRGTSHPPPRRRPTRTGELAAARRIITLSWDGAQVGQIAVQLGCHPRTTAGCTASTRAASMTSATCPARAVPGGLGNWSADGSSPWLAAARLGAWSTNPTAPWPRPTSSSRASGPWTPWLLPPRPRASPSKACSLRGRPCSSSRALGPDRLAGHGKADLPCEGVGPGVAVGVGLAFRSA